MKSTLIGIAGIGAVYIAIQLSMIGTSLLAYLGVQPLALIGSFLAVAFGARYIVKRVRSAIDWACADDKDEAAA